MIKLKIIYINIVVFSLAISSTTKANNWHIKLQSTNNDTVAYAAIKLSKQFQQNSPDSSFYYAKKAVSILKSKNSNLLGKAYTRLGGCYFYNSDYEDAILNYKNAAKIFDNNNEVRKSSIIYNNIGAIYLEMGDYEKSLTHLKKALEIRLKNGYNKLIPSTLISIGDVFSDNYQYETALDYYFEALEMLHKTDDSFSLGSVLSSIGRIYQNLELFNKALDYYETSYQIFDSLNNTYGKATLLGNIGNIYYYQFKDYQKAKKYFDKALELHKILGYKHGESNTINSLGYIALKKNDFKQALELFQKSKAISQENGYLSQLRHNYLSISEVYEVMNKPELALENLKKHLELNDTIHTLESKKQLEKLELYYENYKKEKQIELIKLKENYYTYLINKKDKTKALLLLIIIIIPTLMITTLYFALRYFKIKKTKTLK